MRAFVIDGPGRASVRDVPTPTPGRNEVVVQVERAGICGTDVELFSGDMLYLEDGTANYPLRPGHEWGGRVVEVGRRVDAGWLGAHVTGDTMIGCGVCDRCHRGHHHVCEMRWEIGIRRGWHGALAERLLVPEVSLRRLPDHLAPEVAAFVEPAGNAWRAAHATSARRDDIVCVWGPGTIGLLVVQMLVEGGVVVDVVGPSPQARKLSLALGARAAYHPNDAPIGGYAAVVDASNSREVPAGAIEQVEPTGRVVLVGLADEPSVVDARRATLRDVTVVGILAASAGLAPAIELLGSGAVDPRPLVASTVGLDEVADVLSGRFPLSARGAPKIQVDPRRKTVTQFAGHDEIGHLL